MSSERPTPDDHDLDDFLHGSSRIGAAYREAARQDSAPRELDAAILDIARQAVSTPVRRHPRWIQPLALAATLVLSLGVLLNIWSDPAARRQLSPLAESAMDTAIDSVTPSPIESEAGGPARVEEQKNLAPEVRESAQAPRAEAPPELRKKKEVAAEILAPPPPPPAMADKAAPLGSLSAKPAAPEPAKPQEPAAANAEVGAGSGPAAESSDMIAPSPSQDARRDEASSERDRAAKQRSAPAAASAAEQAAPAQAPAAARREDLAPEQWIDRMRARLAQGDEAGTREAMKEFREAYPDFVLPDELKPYDTGAPR